jgi:hypothetical protein
MAIHWQWLGLALVLLWVPAVLPSELNRRLANRGRLPQSTVASLVGAWMNWVDLIRAAAGTYLLAEFCFTIDSEVRGAGSRALLFRALILLAGVLIQVVRYKRELVFLTPVFYLCGITLVLPGYDKGGFAVFVGWLFAIMGKNPAFQLPVMAVTLGVAGYVLGGLGAPVFLSIGLILCPLVLNFLFQRPQVFLARAVSTPQ